MPIESICEVNSVGKELLKSARQSLSAGREPLVDLAKPFSVGRVSLLEH